jgi:signal transduction histidine kinase
MWLLPELSSSDGRWHLPLCEYSAARIALAVLDDGPEDRAEALAGLLAQDGVLALWVVCRDGRWLSAPPSDWRELAASLDVCIWREFGALARAVEDATTASHRARWGQLAAGAESALRADRPDQAFAVWRVKAADWFSTAGPPRTHAELERTIWFPRWLSGAGVPAGEQLVADGPFLQHWMSPDPRDVALSARLPGMIRRLSRADQLEADFAAALECEKLESLRQMAYGASHEINNPLANIATRAQALLRDETDPERRRRLATIVGQAFRAHEMITDLMLFARPPALNPSTWDLGDLLREVHRELLPDAREQATDLQLSVPAGLSITADRVQAAVAVKALVRNALEAVTEGRAVFLSARHVGSGNGDSSLEITVRDTGPGIGPEARRHLFDPFYSGREAGRGLGFGLSKCWRIARAHGGGVTVDSEPGGGATLTIHLPRECRLPPGQGDRLSNAQQRLGGQP